MNHTNHKTLTIKLIHNYEGIAREKCKKKLLVAQSEFEKYEDPMKRKII